jgi:hypothetical protein
MAISVGAVSAEQVQQWRVRNSRHRRLEERGHLLTRTSRLNGPWDPEITAGERVVHYTAADNVSGSLRPLLDQRCGDLGEARKIGNYV